MPQDLRHAQLFRLLDQKQMLDSAVDATSEPRPRRKELSAKDLAQFLAIAEASWGDPAPMPESFEYPGSDRV